MVSVRHSDFQDDHNNQQNNNFWREWHQEAFDTPKERRRRPKTLKLIAVNWVADWGGTAH
jgi:hypothetical protein